MKYSAWGRGDGEFTFISGIDTPKCDTSGMQLLKVFEAESWDDAMQQYHEWQGWEPYKPFPVQH